MERIAGPGHVNNKFSEGDPNIGQQATMVTARFMNAIQEELASIVELSGGALNPESYQQVYDAIVAIAAGAAGDGSGAVPTTRQLTVSGLVSGGGDLVADRNFHVGKATPAEVAAGTRDDVAVTPYGLQGGSGGRLLAGVGYVTLFGFMFQWGTYSVGPNASTNVTFPTTFPTMCVHADCTGGRLDYGAQDNNPVVSGKSVSGATIFNATDSVGVSGTWLAMGY